MGTDDTSFYILKIKVCTPFLSRKLLEKIVSLPSWKDAKKMFLAEVGKPDKEYLVSLRTCFSLWTKTFHTYYYNLHPSSPYKSVCMLSVQKLAGFCLSCV